MKDSVEEMIFREKVKNWFVRKKKYDENMHKTYALVLVQCTEELNDKLQARKYWETDINNQPIGMLFYFF